MVLAAGRFWAALLPLLVLSKDVLQLNTDPLDAAIDSMAIDSWGRAMYYTTFRPPASLVRIDLNSLARTGAIVFPSSDGQIATIVLDERRRLLYLTTVTSPALVIAVSLSPFGILTRLVLTAGEDGPLTCAMDAAATFLLLATRVSQVAGEASRRPRVTQVALDTLTRARGQDLPSNLLVSNLVVDPLRGEAYISAATDTRVLRVSLASLEILESVVLGSATGNVPILLLNSDAGLLYAVTTESGLSLDVFTSTLLALRAVDFSVQGSVSISPQCATSLSSLHDALNGLLYVTCPSLPGSVVRVRLADLTVETVGQLADTETLSQTAALDVEAGHLWMGMVSGQLVRMGLRDMERSTVVQQYPSQSLDALVALLLDPLSNRLLAISNRLPHIVAALRLPSLSLERQVVLSADDSYIYCGLVDGAAGFAYLPANKGVLRLHLRELARAGFIPLQVPSVAGGSVAADVYAATFGATTGTAYFALFLSPGSIMQIDTRTFTHVRTVALQQGNDWAAGLIYDANTGSLYCSLYSAPYGRVLRLRAADLSIAFVVTLALPQATYLVAAEPGFAITAMTFSGGAALARLRLATMQVVAYAPLESTYELMSAAGFDDANDRLLVVTADEPGVLGTYEGTNPARNSELRVAGGNSRGFVADQQAGSAFVAQSTAPPAIMCVSITKGVSSTVAVQSVQGDTFLRVVMQYGGHLFQLGGMGASVLVRVRLSDFSYAGSILLSPSVPIVCGIRAGKFGFFPTASATGETYRVDLEQFELTERLLLPEQTPLNNFRCVLAHEPTQPLYIGTGNSPAIIFPVSYAAASLAVNVGDAIQAGANSLQVAALVRDYAYFLIHRPGLISADCGPVGRRLVLSHGYFAGAVRRSGRLPAALLPH
jgi:hypothetical protein